MSDEQDWMQKIWDWAKEYELSTSMIPRNREDLLSMENLHIDSCTYRGRPFDVRVRELYQLPEEIGYLKNLKSIRILSNSMDGLPESVGRLVNLKSIQLEMGASFSKLPESMSNLKNLENLDISSGYRDELPRWIGELSNLRRLSFRHCRIITIPYFIGNLTKLEELILSNNKITELPDSIGNLSQLKQLDLRGNNTLIQKHSSALIRLHGSTEILI